MPADPKVIRLHGEIGAEFGAEFRLHVASPGEAIRALCVLVPGFRKALDGVGRYFSVFTGDPTAGRSLEVDQIGFRTDDREIHIVPMVEGAGRGIGKIILGSLLIAASFIVPPAGVFGAGLLTASTVAGLGVSLALGGLSQVLAPTPGSRFDERDNPRRSNLFGTGVNVTTSGATIPFVGGEVEVGSVEISAAVHLEDVIPEDDQDDD